MRATNDKIKLLLGILLMLVIAVTPLVGACKAPAPPPAPAPAPPTPPPAPPPAVIELKFHDGFPPGHYIQKAGILPFIEGVEKRTEGRVKFTHYSAGGLLKRADVYDGISRGIVDVGNGAYVSGVVKLLEVMRLPFAFTGPKHPINAWPELVPLLQKEQTENNLKIIYPIYQTQQQLITSDRLISTLEDFKGLKLRATGYTAKGLEGFGAQTIVLGSPEMYEALQRGTIDGATWSAISTVSLKLYEVIKYITVGYIGAEGASTYFNMDAWNKLPKDIQEIMLDEGRKVARGWAEYLDTEEEKAIATLAEKGVEVYRLPPAERQRWMEATAPLWDAYVKESGDPETAQKLVDIIRKYAN